MIIVVNTRNCPNIKCDVSSVEGNFCPECGTKTTEEGVKEESNRIKKSDIAVAPRQKPKKEEIKKGNPKRVPVNSSTINPNTIKVQFFESMPGRVSLGNNKSFINGVLEIMDNEIVIHKKSYWRGKDRGTKHIRYDKITSIDYDKSKILSPASIQIYLSSVEYSFRSHDKRLESFYERIRQKFDEAQNQETNAITNSSPLDELKKLNELKEMGIVTDEEFELKKKQLLGL